MQEKECEYGICTGCGSKMKLMYGNPEKKGALVIPRHEPPKKCLKPEDFQNLSCSGSAKAPKAEMTAQQ